MIIFVIGQSGQVARALIERAGDETSLVAMGRPDLDVCNKESIDEAMTRLRPSIVVNASAYTAVDKAEEEEAAAFAVNRDGPHNLALACKQAGIPLIHISTDYVFDGSKDEPYAEADQTEPLGVYGRSKLAGEHAIASVLDEHIILRTAWVYSPFGGNFVKTMLRLASGRNEINVVVDQIGCPTSAHDIAGAILALSKKIEEGEAVYGTYNLVGTGETSWHGLAAEVFALSATIGGPFAKVHPIPSSEFPTKATRPANSRLDGTKLAQDYGIAMPHWRDSLRDCVTRLIKEGSFT